MAEFPSFMISPAEQDRFWSKFARVACRIPFAADLLAAWYCAVDPHTPARVRATLLGAIAYFVLPTDAVPDILMGLGFVDDATVLTVAITTVSNHMLPEHRSRANQTLDEYRKS